MNKKDTKGWDALAKKVLDHVSGEGTRRNAIHDYGVKCKVCGRTTYVLDRDDKGRLLMGCAYAMGGGLCLHYYRLSQLEAFLLSFNPKSTKWAMAIMQMAEARDKRISERMFRREGKAYRRCIYSRPEFYPYHTNGEVPKGEPYCTNPEIVSGHGDREWFGICAPTFCEHFETKSGKKNPKNQIAPGCHGPETKTVDTTTKSPERYKVRDMLQHLHAAWGILPRVLPGGDTISESTKVIEFPPLGKGREVMIYRIEMWGRPEQGVLTSALEEQWYRDAAGIVWDVWVRETHCCSFGGVMHIDSSLGMLIDVRDANPEEGNPDPVPFEEAQSTPATLALGLHVDEGEVIEIRARVPKGWAASRQWKVGAHLMGMMIREIG